MTIYEFAKLNQVTQESILNKEAILLDNYLDNHSIIKAYHLQDFFVEVTMDQNKTITDIIPFKRGFSNSQLQNQGIEQLQAA